MWFVVYSFFKESSEEERGHAEKLMEYQVFDISHLKLLLFIDISESFCLCFFLSKFESEFGLVCFVKRSEQTRWKSETAVNTDASF